MTFWKFWNLYRNIFFCFIFKLILLFLVLNVMCWNFLNFKFVSVDAGECGCVCSVCSCVCSVCSCVCLFVCLSEYVYSYAYIYIFTFKHTFILTYTHTYKPITPPTPPTHPTQTQNTKHTHTPTPNTPPIHQTQNACNGISHHCKEHEHL